MKKVITVGLLTAALALSALAQESTWKKSLVGSFNFSQTSLDNWSQGGENAINWQLSLNGSLEKDTDRINWNNTGKLVYGQAKVGDDESRKSADEIRLESVLTYKTSLPVNPYVALAAWTQLADGYAYEDTFKVRISQFMAPGYLTESAGIGYTHGENFTTRLGVAAKQTLSSDDYFWADDPATTDEVETLRSEIGMESVTEFSYKISETALFTSKLGLFSNLKGLNEVDVNWDNLLTAKVARYLDVNFNVVVLYDRDISHKRQLKQVFSLGITYTFL